MIAKSAIDVIGVEAIRKLKEEGFAVVHSQPSRSMERAAERNEWPEMSSSAETWHRMVAESIRLQNKGVDK